MIALVLTFLIVSAAAIDCNCDCDGVKKVTSVDKCDDCEPAKCKTAFATECTNAETVSSSCKDGGANQFDCTLEQSIDAIECVGIECALLSEDKTSSKYCECNERGAECARKAGCKANTQTAAQVAACKKECPNATYCNGAESIMMSTIALVAAVAFVRL